MESSGRKKRSLKGRIVTSLYRAPKSSPMQYSKVKPAPSSTASVSFLVGAGHEQLPVLAAKPNAATAMKGGHGFGCANEGGCYDHGDDNSVDMRASQYISYVQERFRMEQIDYDRRTYC